MFDLSVNLDFDTLTFETYHLWLQLRYQPNFGEISSIRSRVVFVIETSEGDAKSGQSKGRKSSSVVQGQSPNRGLGNKVPRS